MKILVTGDKGLIGRAVTHRLREAGDSVAGFDRTDGCDILDAAALVKDEPLAFVLVGDGHEKERLAARVRDEGLSHVAMFDPVPKAQIPALLAAFDIAYIGWQRVPIYRFGIAPNKLMDYMMAGRAVLHSVEAGNDPVAEGLRQLAAQTPLTRSVMGERGRAYVMAHHGYDVLAQRFVDAVKGS